MNISILLWSTLTLFGAVVLIAMCIVPVLWKKRLIVSDLASAAFIVAIAFLWTVSESALPLLIVLSVLQIFLLIVSLRVRADRLHEMHVRHSTLASVALLSGCSALLALGYIFGDPNYSWAVLSDAVVGLSVAAATVWGAIVLRQLLWGRAHYHVEQLADVPLKQLPTVTLAIPARNETHVLSETLHRAVSSSYPKLEIIVLDDCSQDRTSHLIRSFAQDGVRFIQGDEPTNDWLGKTKALQALQDHASGDYIVFAGVDTALEPGSIERLINHMVHNNLDMVSVLPQRRDGWRFSTLFQQLRYYWQLTLPVTREHVPVATSLWCIRPSALLAQGSFNSVKNRIIPEDVFAKNLHKQGMYHFIVSDDYLGVFTEKKWKSQVDTAIRVLYPMQKRQPVMVLGACLLLSVLLTPYVIGVHGVVAGNFTVITVVGMVGAVLLSVGYALYLRTVSLRVALSGLVTFPLLLVQEIILNVTSMLLYEFSEVNWKGRNVCYPVVNRPDR